jgi:hypothetical protein
MNVPFRVVDYALVLLSGLSVLWVVNYDLRCFSNVLNILSDIQTYDRHDERLNYRAIYLNAC